MIFSPKTVVFVSIIKVCCTTFSSLKSVTIYVEYFDEMHSLIKQIRAVWRCYCENSFGNVKLSLKPLIQGTRTVFRDFVEV